MANLGLGRVALDEKSLCAAARRRTRLADFGDERFREGLRKQLKAYENDSRLTYLGRLLARFQVVRCLSNRLEIEEQLKRNPEVCRVNIPRPLIIVSLPRTGTTFLFNLLAQDPASRALMLWEAMRPGRVSRRRGSNQDQRLRKAARAVWLISKIAPGLRALHLPGPDDPEECLYLFQNTFLGPGLVERNLTKFLQEIPTATMEWAYQDYYRQLQLLESQRPAPGHWLLKSINHMFSLDTLSKTLPHASIVQIHRDPTQSLASMCHLLAQFCGIFFDDERWKTFGPDILMLYVEALRRSMEARKKIPPDRILDVSYRDLSADPIGVVRRIYSYFGYTYTDQFDNLMRVWLRDKSKPARAKGYYSFEQFGIDRGSLEKAFAFYSEHYHLDLP